ncbi:MAG: succinyl-CoA synthetase subunit alpha [Candidatus Methanolliviera sp. GoM_asphalt]|nr:MAG: succinyl-CoA synthetase subunit alpha [Candidatus Methanolliviera sp. GoM_asphalt]
MNRAEHFLDPFFYPKSVAIVGATGNQMKMNYHITKNLLRLKFLGKVYLVNPNSDEILGMKTYPSLNDISDDIDLVISAVSYNVTLKIIKDCTKKGIKRIVIVAGGFQEAGKKGEELHREIARLTRESKMRVLGPNTLSPINTSNNLLISFHSVEKLRRGGISFVFQSGLYEYKLNWIFSHLGVGKIIDLGNKMDINEVDALEYLAEDPETKVIAMHLESMRGDGRRFMQLLRDTSRKKPIVILKSGRSSAGAKAAASHTGAIARENDALFDGMLRQAGIIRAQNLDEFFDFAKIFGFTDNLPGDNRTVVVNLSGGEGVIATDACEQNGLKMAKLGEKTYKRIREIFPPWDIPLNPLDAGVCMEFHMTDFSTTYLNKFFDDLTSILEDEEVDCMIMQLPSMIFAKILATLELSKSAISGMMDGITDIFLRMKERGKPLALWRSSMDAMEDDFVNMLESKKIPVYSSSERAIKAMAALYKYKSMRDKQRWMQ